MVAARAVVVRNARADEWPDLVAIHQAAATAAYGDIFGAAEFPLDETRRRWRSFAGDVLVAELDAQAAGFAAFDAAELHALYVHSSHWRHGLGSRLLRAIPDSVRLLWVLRDNAGGRRFYEEHGWHPDGAARPAYGAVEVRYRRDLSRLASC